MPTVGRKQATTGLSGSVRAHLLGARDNFPSLHLDALAPASAPQAAESGQGLETRLSAQLRTAAGSGLILEADLPRCYLSVVPMVVCSFDGVSSHSRSPHWA
jgi:hypothetical protein